MLTSLFSLIFMSLVSFTGSYTEVEPKNRGRHRPPAQFKYGAELGAPGDEYNKPPCREGS